MLRLHFVILTASLSLGCSRSAAPNKPGGDSKPGGDQQTNVKPQPGATDGGPGFDIPAEKPVPAVPFAKLIELLPAVPGYQAEKATGANVEFGEHQHSHVEQTHRKDEESVTVKIVDTAHIQALYLPFTMAAKFKTETTEGYQRGTTIDGNPAIEKYQKDSKNGELTVLVGKRFLVEIHTDNAPENFARTIYSKIDAKKLAGLK